ncbi:NUDIX hydrolase [Pseudomonas vanderleydeniana]|uniref:NUDIX hydrolase n=1 Tax=Pseudomonas vanderleydeniana TaxID=2745495 RepID=A0A9E6PGN4_9PSED|nr:NUDIX hydrolase [Pseudomonas vanderleydeniana]QXI25703.1 NUDIX hydrolase [Pseudomonas vanderleydeniana]
MSEQAFSGAKLALICGDQLLTYLRDMKESIPYPGHWDFAGGGREGEETPSECALRELDEEFSLRLGAERIEWTRRYPSVTQPGSHSWFLVGQLSQVEIAAIRFGDEGQYWRMMPIAEYLAHPLGVPYLQERLRDYLQDR